MPAKSFAKCDKGQNIILWLNNTVVSYSPFGFVYSP